MRIFILSVGILGDRVQKRVTFYRVLEENCLGGIQMGSLLENGSNGVSDGANEIFSKIGHF